MSNYRIAFLFCRVISNGFLLSAVLGFASLVLTFFGLGGSNAMGLIGFVVIGSALHFFSSTIASTIVGQSAFEGEALSNTIEREPQFRAFKRMGTGLLLLTFGASQLISTVISIGAAYSFWMSGNAYDRIYSLLGTWFIAPVLQVALGLYMAFGGALKRLTRSLSGVELASPDETASKPDSSS